MHSKKLKKIALLPNVITAFGLSCGLFVIFKTTMIQSHEINEYLLLKMTAILLLASLADLLDGAIARVIQAESEFGGLFDSLADSISFGVAPTLIILKSLSVAPGTPLSFLVTLSSLTFCLCGVLRLVRYSVNALAIKNSNEAIVADQKHFTGLPIPAAAAAAISLNLFLFSDGVLYSHHMMHLHKIWILSFAMILLGYCMISRWKFPSIKTLGIKVRSFQILFFTVLAAALIFYGILHYFSLVFLIISWGYVIIAWLLALIRLTTGRKSKTLAEFEPDNEDDFEEENETLLLK